jgi:hypothetical protein
VGATRSRGVYCGAPEFAGVDALTGGAAGSAADAADAEGAAAAGSEAAFGVAVGEEAGAGNASGAAWVGVVSGAAVAAGVPMAVDADVLPGTPRAGALAGADAGAAGA